MCNALLPTATSYSATATPCPTALLPLILLLVRFAIKRTDKCYEACKAKLRDAKVPTEQMEGKCNRSRKLEDRCAVLGQKMLEEQKGEEQALEKQNSMQRQISSTLMNITSIKKRFKGSRLKPIRSSRKI